jgi:RNA polymerase sigma-70 factor, ECF subfamily
VDEYLPRVYRFALALTRSRQEAEDLVQETYVRAWRRRRQLQDPKAAAAWLFSIAKNAWTDRLRRKARRRAATEPLGDDYQDPAAGPDRGLVVREDLGRVLEAMDSLPPRQREVLHLHACQGLSLQEIADVLGITTQAAKASICEARKRLRQRCHEIDCSVTHEKKERR